ncbi:ABC transporter ATP-binding protein, partial [Micromonospora echinofusca]
MVLGLGTALAAGIDPWLPARRDPDHGDPWLLRRHAERHGAQVRAATTELTADIVHGLRELTVFGALQRHRAHLAARTQQLGRIQRRSTARAGAEAALIDTLVAVAVAVAGIGAVVVLDGVHAGRLDATAGPMALVLAGAILGPASQVAPYSR